MQAFARYFESRIHTTDRQIIRAIDDMIDQGCRRDEENKFPECKDEFNEECIKCQFGKKYIKNQDDIDRFNEQEGDDE